MREPDDVVRAPDVQPPPPWSARQGLVAFLVVVATVALFTVGVAGQDPVIRWIAVAVAGSTAAPSLVLAQKRGNLAGWYVVSAGVMALRLLTGD
ncbi:MAG: hypothetical protein AAGC90_14940 [Curtobacterium sp.]